MAGEMTTRSPKTSQRFDIEAPQTKPPLLEAARGMSVVMGPSLLVDLFVVAGTTSLIRRLLDRRRARQRLPLSLALAGAALPFAYALLIRPWHLRWGATDEELAKPLIGDELVPDSSPSSSTRAITIDAPLEEVWPWLAQIGQDRAGFYSYDWLENLAGCQLKNADRIHPEWQHREIGEELRLLPSTGPRVAAFEPGKAIVLKGWGTFAIESLGENKTRVILRTRGERGLKGIFFNPFLGEFPHFVMERRMLLGLKQRAEQAKVELANSKPQL